MKLLDNTSKKCRKGNINNGLFDIYMLDNNITLYKKVNNNKGVCLTNILKKEESKYLLYKKKIEDSYKIKYNHTIRGYDVESDGSYKCMYIEGYRLDRISDSIDLNILLKIKNAANILKTDLNCNKKNLTGDWALHNLIYSIKDDKIYNIDIEGFFSYPVLPKDGKLKHINKWLHNLIKKIDNLL